MKIGRFSILEKIGDGPFSSVYKAEDTTKGCIVAIKIWQSPARSRGIYDTLIHDIQPILALKHAHILPVFEVNANDDILYFVSMYASGGSIKDLQRRYPHQIVPVNDVISIITQIGRALQYAYLEN